MTLNKRMEEKINHKITIEDDFGKPLSAMIVFSSSIKFLTDDMVVEVNKQIAGALSKSDVKWVLTVPAIWTDSAKRFMREAAIQAGIDTDKLKIALEPEAASIYCRHLSVDRTNQNVSISQFQPGTKYMILDAGGGTIDITVHEIQPGGGLREVYVASGGAWGAILVDDAFKTFLIDIFGEKVYIQFANEETEDWIDLWRDFEAKKKTIDPGKSSKVVMRFPQSIFKLFQKRKVSSRFTLSMSSPFKKQTLADSVSTSKYSEDVVFSGDKIKLQSSLVEAFFDNSLQKIVSHVKSIMENPKVRDIKAILMVGGFSDSPMLQNAVKEAFPDVTVIIPIDAASTILKGAVIFGHEPETITERVLKYSYGVACSEKFIDGVHPESKKFYTKARGTICSDIFNKHVEKFQSVKVGESLSPRKYKPMEKYDTLMNVSIYASEHHNPQFIDQGCTEIGTIRIEFPDPDGDLDREVAVSFAFGGTEIEVTGKDERTGEKTNVTLDYQVRIPSNNTVATWHDYVIDNLMTPGDMCSAGIYGLDGKEWAAVGPVHPNPKDIVRLINMITGKDKVNKGIKINGVRFLCIGHDIDERMIKLVQKATLLHEKRYACAGYLSHTNFIFGVVMGREKIVNCCEVLCRARDHLDQSEC